MVSIVRIFFDLLKDIYNYFHFPNAYIAFRGVFASFEEALGAIPKHREVRGVSYNDSQGEDMHKLIKTYSKPVILADTEYPHKIMDTKNKS